MADVALFVLAQLVGALIGYTISCVILPSGRKVESDAALQGHVTNRVIQ